MTKNGKEQFLSLSLSKSKRVSKTSSTCVWHNTVAGLSSFPRPRTRSSAPPFSGLSTFSSYMHLPANFTNMFLKLLHQILLFLANDVKRKDKKLDITSSCVFWGQFHQHAYTRKYSGTQLLFHQKYAPNYTSTLTTESYNQPLHCML
jgi:hypothetical protein